jgi:hypothetical protein
MIGIDPVEQTFDHVTGKTDFRNTAQIRTGFPKYHETNPGFHDRFQWRVSCDPFDKSD